MDEFHLASIETPELIEELASRTEWAVILYEPVQSPENDSTVEFHFPGDRACELIRTIGLLRGALAFAEHHLCRKFDSTP